MKGRDYKRIKIKVRRVRRRIKKETKPLRLMFKRRKQKQTRHSEVRFNLLVKKTFAVALALIVMVGTSGLAILTAAFEAHVINVTAKIENHPCSIQVGFETDASGIAIQPGQELDDEYALFGVNISAANNKGNHPDKAIAFDATNPTGGDVDLGTPNETFGGPGIGNGGEEGKLGENAVSQGNILIIAENDKDEDSDGFIDTPDDEARGGAMVFDFDGLAKINSIRVIDVDRGESSSIQLYGTSGLIVELPIASLGNNSAQTIQVNTSEVKSMHVILSGSGAVDDLCFEHNFEPPEPPEEQVCDALSIGYWKNHEGCSQGDGNSIWESDIQNLSNEFSGYFSSITSAEICEALWTPNCPGGNSNEARLCKATIHILADQLNVVSGHLDLDALLAGADDGDAAFDELGLSSNSSVKEALTTLEIVLATADADNYRNALHVAERMYTFYEEEHSNAPQCVYEEIEISRTETSAVLITTESDESGTGTTATSTQESASSTVDVDANASSTQSASASSTNATSTQETLEEKNEKADEKDTKENGKEDENNQEEDLENSGDESVENEEEAKKEDDEQEKDADEENKNSKNDDSEVDDSETNEE